ncbi:MAG: cytochrome c oxidase subunit II [Pseudomonadota bacterium]
MTVSKRKQVLLCFVTAFMSLVCGFAFAEGMPLNLTEGVTPTSKKVYDLHMIILYIVTAIGVVVFAIMCWSIYFHRKSRGAVAAQFHHSTFAEVTWTVIPIIILIIMAIPATKTLIFMEQTGDSEMTIKVTGYQWKWKYDYLEEDISFYSTLSLDSNIARQPEPNIKPEEVEHYLLDVDNPVVVPIETKIRILTTAADVNHAWWVPDLGWKRDAIPGFINDNWTYVEKVGTYRGQCAELCGKDHGFMPIVLKAVSKEDYAVWVKTMKGGDEPVVANTAELKQQALATNE